MSIIAEVLTESVKKIFARQKTGVHSNSLNTPQLVRWILFPQTLDFDMILRQALSVYAHKQPRGLSKKLQNTECDYDLDQLLDLKYLSFCLITDLFQFKGWLCNHNGHP